MRVSQLGSSGDAPSLVCFKLRRRQEIRRFPLCGSGHQSLCQALSGCPWAWATAPTSQRWETGSDLLGILGNVTTSQGFRKSRNSVKIPFAVRKGRCLYAPRPGSRGYFSFKQSTSWHLRAVPTTPNSRHSPLTTYYLSLKHLLWFVWPRRLGLQMK